MSYYATRTLRVGDHDFLRGQKIKGLKEEEVDFLERRGLIFNEDAPASTLNPAQRAAQRSLAVQKEAGGGNGSTTATEASEDGSEDSSEWPKRTSEDSSWYKLSSGRKVQGEDAAYAAQKEIDEGS